MTHHGTEEGQRSPPPLDSSEGVGRETGTQVNNGNKQQTCEPPPGSCEGLCVPKGGRRHLFEGDQGFLTDCGIIPILRGQGEQQTALLGGCGEGSGSGGSGRGRAGRRLALTALRGHSTPAQSLSCPCHVEGMRSLVLELCQAS